MTDDRGTSQNHVNGKGTTRGDLAASLARRKGLVRTSATALPPPHMASDSSEAYQRHVAAGTLKLLIVDDDSHLLKACGEVASKMGFEVERATTASEARAFCKNESPDVVLMNLGLPAGGLSLLYEIRDARPRASVVVMTAFATVSSAVEAMRTGAADYLTKPFAMDELTDVLDRAGQRRTFEIENKRIRERLTLHGDGLLIGTSAEIEKLHRIVQKVAPASHPVLIIGESGTGKETVARAIHAGSPNANRPFHVLECGQLAPTVLEAELFGYARGALTGENRSKEGLLTGEAGGTLFLEGVSEIPLDLQSKLLRALQDRKVRPAGADQAVPLTVRVLAGSNRNLSALVDQGAFRKDLYYKLNIVSLRIPPLRERRDDIPVLAEHFLKRLDRERLRSHHLDPEMMRVMNSYDWPGNIRELERCIEHACTRSSGPVLHISDLPTELRAYANTPGVLQDIVRIDTREAPTVPKSGHLPVDRRAPAPIVSIADLEREAILHTIRQLRGDKLMAAKLLGIGKTTLYRKLKEYGIAE